MTLFDFVLPLIALGVAGVGILLIDRSAKRLERGGDKDHPAE